jgi:hypothetical protein
VGSSLRGCAAEENQAIDTRETVPNTQDVNHWKLLQWSAISI